MREVKPCTAKKRVEFDYSFIEVKCQLGIHAAGHCRAVLKDDIIVMWPKK